MVRILKLHGVDLSYDFGIGVVPAHASVAEAEDIHGARSEPALGFLCQVVDDYNERNAPRAELLQFILTGDELHRPTNLSGDTFVVDACGPNLLESDSVGHADSDAAEFFGDRRKRQTDANNA